MCVFLFDYVFADDVHHTNKPLYEKLVVLFSPVSDRLVPDPGHSVFSSRQVLVFLFNLDTSAKQIQNV